MQFCIGGYGVVDSSNNIIYIADCNELTNKFYKIKNIQ